MNTMNVKKMIKKLTKAAEEVLSAIEVNKEDEGTEKDAR